MILYVRFFAPPKKEPNPPAGRAGKRSHCTRQLLRTIHSRNYMLVLPFSSNAIPLLRSLLLACSGKVQIMIFI